MRQLIGVLTVMAVITLGASDAGGAIRWHVQAAPLPSGAVNGWLNGVSCTARTACTAVGTYSDNSGPYAALAERWNGRHWAVQPTPNPIGTDNRLNGVSCTVSTNCVAVGVSGSNQAVASALAEGWDGMSWLIQPTPQNQGGAPSSELRGVSCTSPTACTAVGYAGVLRWSGPSWVPQAQSPESLAVSCTSSTACIAVSAFNSSAVAYRWDGVGWVAQRLARPPGAVQSSLVGVSCTSTKACTAVGSYNKNFDDTSQTLGLVERWDGTRWKVQATPTLPGATINFPPMTSFSGVSCTSNTSCTAVGEYDYLSSRTVRETSLAEHWDGEGWSAETLPSLSGEVENRLTGVSCTSSTTCVAVGLYNVAASVGCTPCFPLVERSSPLATAKLTGIPVACVEETASFTAHVEGSGISAVTWMLDNKRIRGHTVDRGTRYAALISVLPGSHRLAAMVKFMVSSHTRPRRFQRTVSGCPDDIPRLDPRRPSTAGATSHSADSDPTLGNSESKTPYWVAYAP